MAETIVGVNLTNDSGNDVAGWNNFYDTQNDAAGQLSADLSDTSSVSTGYTLSLGGPFSASLGSSGFATSSPDPRFPLLFFQSLWYVGLSNDDSATLTLGNLPVGEPYKIEAAAANNNASRPTTFSATGSTPASALYTADTLDPVPQPVVLEGTVPAGGEVTLSNIGSSSFAYNNGFLLTIGTASAIPTITDIDTDESVYPGQSFVITGTNFGATQGSGTVDIDGVTQTVTSWGDTSITCTAVRGGNEYGTGKTLTVTTDAASTATLGVAQEAEPGTFAVTAASPNTTDDASLWTGLVDTATSNPVTVVDGDQAWVKDPNNLGNLAVTPSGEISADSEGDFVVQFWRLSEGVWGSDQTVSFTASSGGLTDLELRKKQNSRRRYTANLFGAWRNNFMGGDNE